MTGTAHKTLTLTVNGSPRTTEAATLAELVAALGHGPEAVATAVNGDFVAISARTTTRLSPGDTIEIVSAREGG